MDLVIGCMCYEISQSLKEKMKVTKICSWIECVLYLIIFWAIFIDSPATIEIPLLICLAVAVIITISEKNAITIWDNKVSYFLGKISMPLYLLHCLVIQSMLLIFDNIQNWAMFALFVGISISGAILFWFVVEKLGSKKA